MLIQSSTKKSIFEAMRTYLVNNEFNQDYVDIVPQMLANCLQINITIIDEKQNNSTEIKNRTPREREFYSVSASKGPALQWC